MVDQPASPQIAPPTAPTRISAFGGRLDAEELLDRPDLDAAELAANLRDIRLVNLLGGGTRTTLLHLPKLLAAVPSERPALILDLATGSADLPRAIVRWARRRQRAVHILATDRSASILAEATAQTERFPEIDYAQLDARRTGLPDSAVDIVLCSLALHHFAPAEAIEVLAEMQRLARVGGIVNDIRRSRLGYLAAWGSSRIATRNRLTRHDMPLSVRRAYTDVELADLLGRSGIHNAAISRHPLFRMAAVWGPLTTAGAPAPPGVIGR